MFVSTDIEVANKAVVGKGISSLGPIYVDDKATFLSNIVVEGDVEARSTSHLSNAIIAKEVVEDSYAKKLSIDLSSASYMNVDGTVSSLHDLSNSLQN